MWAGIAKIPNPGPFAQTVRAYDILPLSLVHPFSVVVPWIEAITGLFLVLGLWTRSGVLVALALLLCFGAALGVNLYRGVALSCGCFGPDGTGGSLYGALVRDVLLLSTAAVLASVRNIPFSLDRFLHWRSPL
jgi:uncharacterized membrane protein YphA (DoxX/SURF4 family)